MAPPPRDPSHFPLSIFQGDLYATHIPFDPLPGGLPACWPAPPGRGRRTSRSIPTPSAASRPAPSVRPAWAAASRRSTPWARIRSPSMSERPAAASGSRPTAASSSSRSSTTTTSRSAPSPSIPRTRRRSGWAPASRGPATAPRSATASTRATDGGDSWQRVGLENTERIARVQVSPADGNTVWVCATGHLWDSHPDRGVYKTTDGGKTWKKVLYVDADTGCSDLAVDPQDPSILYAGMWQFRRTPHSFSLRRQGERPVQVDRRRRDLEAAQDRAAHG